MRILLVEDDTRLQTSLTEILREAGYAVDVSGDGIEGLFFGEEYPVDWQSLTWVCPVCRAWN